MPNQKRKPISGAQYKAFMNDQNFWPEDLTVDDVLLVIDGVNYGEDRDLELDMIADSASIVIESGEVLRDGTRIHNLDDYFYSWEQELDSEILVIRIPKSATQEIRSKLMSMGVEILDNE